MTDHSILAPSSAARWGDQCPGSVALEAKAPLPSDPSAAQDAAEGDAAHWVAAQGLRGHSVQVDTASPNGVIVTDEMLEAAEIYIDDVRKLPALNATFHLEERIACPKIHPENWGTPDLWAFCHSTMTLHLWEFKYGHRFVDAFLNWQMVDYTAGIVDHADLRGVDPKLVTVIFNVVQPRNYHQSGPIRRWATTLAELEPYWNSLSESAIEAMRQNPPTRVGPQCKDCRGRHTCEALHAAAENAADVAMTATPMELTGRALGVELRMLKRAQSLLNARVDGLEAVAMAEIRAGKSVSFFQIEQTRGREVWTVDADTVRTTGELLGLELTKAKPITPGQARKAGAPADMIATMTDRPGGAFTLVPCDTKEARKVFGKGV